MRRQLRDQPIDLRLRVVEVRRYADADAGAVVDDVVAGVEGAGDQQRVGTSMATVPASRAGSRGATVWNPCRSDGVEQPRGQRL